MTPKKTYYYDYRSTIDVPPLASPKPIGVGGTPPQYSLPVEKPNFLPIILVVVLIIAIIYLATSLFPKNYSSCTQFPGSKTTTYPGTCTTFYGKSFIQLSENIQEPNLEPTPTPTPTETITEEPSVPTTKGGLPLTTPTPSTKKPTPKLTPGSTTSDTNNHPADWTKHRYPTQKFALYLPPRFTSTNVTHNTDTNISSFTLYDGNTSVIRVSLQPNWSNASNAQNQSITFMLPDNIGVIKLTSNTTYNYYFEKNSQVYIFSCTIDSSTCDTIIKSISWL